MELFDIEDYIIWVEDSVKKILGTEEEMRKDLLALASQILHDVKCK